MAKTVTFSPWWQPFNSFCLEALSFFSLFPFFLFATQKSGDAMPPSPPSPSPWCRQSCYWFQNSCYGDSSLSEQPFQIAFFLNNYFSKQLFFITTTYKNSHQRCFVKKAVLKNFATSTGKHLCWSLFLIMLQAFSAATLLKRDSNTVIFLWLLRNL